MASSARKILLRLEIFLDDLEQSLLPDYGYVVDINRVLPNRGVGHLEFLEQRVERDLDRLLLEVLAKHRDAPDDGV